MTHAELRQWFYAQLSDVYAQGELQSMYHWCVAEIHDWSRTEVYTRNDESVNQADLNQWKSATDRLDQSQPIQYIFNKAPFFDFDLYVDENVLIPRPETEELVQLLLEENSGEKMSVLDIGTGSGCIPIAIKKARPNWKVSACDVSQGALEVARKNCEKFDLVIDLIHADVGNMDSISSIDILISNPPYIPMDRKETLEQNVLDNEPHLALFSPENEPFYFFRIITEWAVKSNVQKVYFETHATDMHDLLASLNPIWNGTVRTVKDLGGKERFVILERSQ